MTRQANWTWKERKPSVGRPTVGSLDSMMVVRSTTPDVDRTTDKQSTKDAASNDRGTSRAHREECTTRRQIPNLMKRYNQSIRDTITTVVPENSLRDSSVSCNEENYRTCGKHWPVIHLANDSFAKSLDYQTYCLVNRSLCYEYAFVQIVTKWAIRFLAQLKLQTFN